MTPAATLPSVVLLTIESEFVMIASAPRRVNSAIRTLSCVFVLVTFATAASAIVGADPSPDASGPSGNGGAGQSASGDGGDRGGNDEMPTTNDYVGQLDLLGTERQPGLQAEFDASCAGFRIHRCDKR